MRRLFASLFTLALLTASPAFAVMEDYPSIKLQGLDKSVGRTVTFEATVGSTIQYGPLFIKIHACRKAPPIEKPESAAFLQIWEVPPGQQKSEWVFSGWMFASSPALSAMDHPVYDVWVLDCTGREEPNEEAASAQTDKQADQTGLPPVDPNAVQQEAPAAVDETIIPTDSEAEEPEMQSPSQPSVPQGGGSTYPDAGSDAAPVEYPPLSQPAQPYPQQVPETNTSSDPTLGGQGVTAYDFMSQPSGTMAKEPAPEPYPAYPSAPESRPAPATPQY